jgi:peroxiredoxin
MSTEPTTLLPLGAIAPEFSLTDTVSGKTVALSDVKAPAATVVMFICNHCPYVKHVQSQLVQLVNDYKSKGVGFAAISANDVVAYPEDGPEAMKETAQRLSYPFPYLYDESQAVARSYTAVCTPDMFVFDRNLKLAYRGQLDDTRPNSGVPSTGKDVRAALDALIAGKPVSTVQKPSVGCSIKWKN